MAQNSFALMTTLGRSKEAAALANATAVVITHIAIGDGATVPSGGETALYNEVARKAISGHGTVIGSSDTAYFDIFLEADEGPYTIREAGLIDEDGDLIAIARYDPPINKPIPSSGQTVEGTVRLEVAFSNITNITVVVDPSYKVPLQRLNRLPWLPILSMSVTAPPASPVAGDVYLVPTGATGAWAGQTGKIAEYTAAGWGIITPPDGHGVSLPDGRIFERIDDVYVEKLALDVQSGKWGYAEASGTANVITATLNPALIAYAAGLTVHLKITTTNTGAVTVNWNGLGAKAVVDRIGTALSAGDLVAGEIVKLTYDGTRFRTPFKSDGANQLASSTGWVRLSGGIIMQWGGFTGNTNAGSAGGVYESGNIAITWPIAFPNAIFQCVAGCGTDVVGTGLQEQAWFLSTTKTGGVALVACRSQNVSLSGSYIVFGY
ncbi:phage tail protein [Brucella anthropi]|uniref:phage tail-collar fiber domain-containing protein n=1 Tax=Brucella anthropi TaxID=529 RepID=UPI00244B6F1B|nr:phage tail protein [Brucella anthropi]MDH0366724.1 phage tail protein [Brucella anthropi]